MNKSYDAIDSVKKKYWSNRALNNFKHIFENIRKNWNLSEFNSHDQLQKIAIIQVSPSHGVDLDSLKGPS